MKSVSTSAGSLEVLKTSSWLQIFKKMLVITDSAQGNRLLAVPRNYCDITVVIHLKLQCEGFF